MFQQVNQDSLDLFDFLVEPGDFALDFGILWLAVLLIPDMGYSSIGVFPDIAGQNNPL